MPDVSAALIVLSGAVLIIAGLIPSAITNNSRTRLVGFDVFILGAGLLAWTLSFFAIWSRLK
jgi:hypothetical protein